MKRNLSFFLARWSLKTFGNTLGVRTNVYYKIFEIYCKMRSKIEITSHPGIRAEITRLKTDGFVRLSELAEVEEISKKVQNHFLDNPPKDGNAPASHVFAGELTDDLFKIVEKHIRPRLELYYGSNFQTYWITVFQYLSGFPKTAASSFGYHIDDNPKQLMKVFIYLNDTYESNAAFRAFNYRDSNTIFEKGFVSYDPESRVRSQSLIDVDFEKKHLQILEGKAGTMLIFDNNLVHKGTAPVQGYRNVICLEVYPSPVPMSAEDIRISLTKPFQRDYPINPFYNDILIERRS